MGLAINQVMAAFTVFEHFPRDQMSLFTLRSLVKAFECKEEISNEFIHKLMLLTDHSNISVQSAGILAVAKVCAVLGNARSFLEHNILLKIANIIEPNFKSELTEASLELITQIARMKALQPMWHEQMSREIYPQLVQLLVSCCSHSNSPPGSCLPAVRRGCLQALLALGEYKDMGRRMVNMDWGQLIKVKDSEDCQVQFLQLLSKLTPVAGSTTNLDMIMSEFIPMLVHLLQAKICNNQASAVRCVHQLCTHYPSLMRLVKQSVFKILALLLTTADCLTVQTEITIALQLALTNSSPDLELLILGQISEGLMDCQETIEPIVSNWVGRVVEASGRAKDDDDVSFVGDQETVKLATGAWKGVKRLTRLVMEKIKMHGGVKVEEDKQVSDVCIPRPMSPAQSTCIKHLFQLLEALLQLQSFRTQIELEGLQPQHVRRFNSIRLPFHRPVNLPVCWAMLSLDILLCVDFLSGYTQIYIASISDTKVYDTSNDPSDKLQLYNGQVIIFPAAARSSSSNQSITQAMADPDLFSKPESEMIEAIVSFLATVSSCSVPFLKSESERNLTLHQRIESEMKQEEIPKKRDPDGVIVFNFVTENDNKNNPAEEKNAASEKNNAGDAASAKPTQAGGKGQLKPKLDDCFKGLPVKSETNAEVFKKNIPSMNHPASKSVDSFFGGKVVVCDYCCSEKVNSKQIDSLSSWLSGGDGSSQNPAENGLVKSPYNMELNRCTCEQLKNELKAFAHEYEQRLLREEAPIQRRVRTLLYEAGVVEAVGPLLLSAISGKIQQSVLILLQNMVQYLPEKPARILNKSAKHRSQVSSSSCLSNQLETIPSVLKRLSNKTRDFMEKNFGFTTTEKTWQNSSDACMSTTRSPSSSGSSAGRSSRTLSSRPKSAVSYQYSQYNRYARSSTSSTPLAATQESHPQCSKKSSPKVRVTPGEFCYMEKKAQRCSSAYPPTKKRLFRQQHPQPVYEPFCAGPLHDQAYKDFVVAKPILPRSDGGKVQQSKPTKKSPKKAWTEEEVSAPRVPQVKFMKRASIVYNKILPMNVLGPTGDSKIESTATKSEPSHHCSGSPWFKTRPGSASRTLTRPKSAFPALGSGVTESLQDSDTNPSQPIGDRRWVKWKPDLDPNVSLAEQCRCLVASVMGPMLIKRMFAQDEEERKKALNLVHEYVENAQAESRMKMSEVGIIPKMVEFLRAHENDDVFAAMGLSIVECLVQADLRLQFLFYNHGGFDLLTAMTYYCTGYLKDRVKSALKIIHSDFKGSMDRPFPLEIGRQGDVWEQLSNKWQKQDEIDEIFKKYSGRGTPNSQRSSEQLLVDDI